MSEQGKDQEKRGDLVKVGALWVNRTKQGDLCLTGRMGDALLLVFKNQYKAEEKHPDYFVYVARPTEKGHARKGDDGWDDNAKKVEAESLFEGEQKKSDSESDKKDNYDEIPF